MSSDQLHNEWLSLIEISGPFLAIPVLKEVFPQGLEELDGIKRKRLRQAYDEWREAWETDDPQFPDLHRAWIEEVLAHGLELDEDGRGDVLKSGGGLPESLRVALPEHGITLAPDMAVVDEQQGDKALLLIHVHPAEVDLEATSKLDGWAASPAERMVQLCRLSGCRLGIVTNGERWMLIDAPVGAVTTYASWYARLWGQEPITLQAFVHLLGIRRFFFDTSEQLPALLDRSLKFQDEVTDALGEQVRRAVEVLIQSLDKADLDRNRELLRDVAPTELYEAGLTVMMRLVFLLSAEERGLLLLGDERYEAHYALSTLRLQLRAESEEILERRWDAWSRLLAIFRAVFGGIEHENLRMPALGGSLFDPDRFPFLEGRAKGSNWRTDTAKPLPIDNRTVLLLLDAIQQFQGRTLSYRALDVEQIGYVYEGLLERTVKRTSEVTLELDATKSAKSPWITLGELESARLDGGARLAALLQERCGSSASRVRNDLAKAVEDTLADRLLTACQADIVLRDRIKPYVHLLRTDPWGYPLVYPTGAFIVTTGSDRRETGTHYTPKSLTEAIVGETLTPITFVGPAEGKPREVWVLKSPAELLDLKICDPAMGSGAFLVQACRCLSDRLVEAWSLAETNGRFVTVDGDVTTEAADNEPLPRDAEARTVIARRLIAERCLYGVDLNPLAVELAKLSIWLVTLAKGRPFGFLDHNLRCGDSLLGIHRLDQLTELSMSPGRVNAQMRVFGRNIEQAMRDAIELRQRLREMPIRDIHDVEAMARLDADARRCLEVPERIADAFIGEVFSMSGNTAALEMTFATLAIQAEQAIDGDQDSLKGITTRASKALSVDVPQGQSKRRPFHWPLEFPEVFGRQNEGFDAIVGNPPFLGGRKITGTLGDAYREYLVLSIADGNRGSSADLVAYFFLRTHALLRKQGCSGLLAVNTIAEGDSRQVGLERLLQSGAVIFAAVPNEPWPGKAAVVTSRVHLFNGDWSGPKLLAGKQVSFISAFLSGQEDWSPKPLVANAGKSFQGSIVLGMGFVLSDDLAQTLIARNPKNEEALFPYLNGDDLNSHPEQQPSRWVINFWDWPLDRKANGSWNSSDERQRSEWLKLGSVPGDFPGRVAEDFPDLIEIIDQKVRPERQRQNARGEYVLRRPLPQRWWQYADKRPALYHAIGRGRSFFKHPDEWVEGRSADMFALVLCRVSKTLAFTIVPNEWVFSEATVVMPFASYQYFAVLQSSVHAAYAWQHASKLKNDLRYSPSDAFEPFPFPDRFGELETLGQRYYLLRKAIMKDENIGLTDLYARLHSPRCNHEAIKNLRDLHRAIDEEVRLQYGWSDLRLDHGFHEVDYLPVNARTRYTISEDARYAILKRLALLNRSEWERERQEENRHQRASGTRPPPKAKRKPVSKQPDLFPIVDGNLVKTGSDCVSNSAHEVRQTVVENPWGVAAVDQILAWLEAHDGWYPKGVILSGCGALPDTWNEAIEELLADEFVQSRGEGDATRYQAMGDGRIAS